MSKFVAVASQTSVLGSDQFVRSIFRVWKNLQEDAERAKTLLNDDPDNDALGKSAIEKAERFLAFGELISCAENIVESGIKRMRQMMGDGSSIEVIDALDVDETTDVRPKN